MGLRSSIEANLFVERIKCFITFLGLSFCLENQVVAAHGVTVAQ